MKKTYFLLLSLYLLSSSASLAQKKPNILFIGVDDLSIAFDAYGNPDAHCPNFARLLEHGMWFKQAYVQYPLCSPSRTSIFSGQRPDSTGIIDNITSIRNHLGPDFKFLPEYFNAYGYRTEKFGKFTCEHESEISWDFVFNKYVHEPSDSALGGDPVWWIDTAHKNEMQTLSGTVVINGLIPKLKKPLATPYFYSLGLTAHTPFTPIINSWNKTGDSQVQELLPVDIYGTLTNVQGNGSANIILPETPPDDTADIPLIALKDLLSYTPDQTRKIRHAYYSEIMQEDLHLGLVLDAMDSLHLWDSTIVVFWSDHGLHMGEHQGLWLKATLFEESLRVPFVICAPGKKKGICNTVVELVDIFPTLTELCDLPKAPNLNGSSLVPLLENPDILWKKAAFSQVKRFIGIQRSVMGRSVRTNNYHYNYWLEYGEELYDINNDPHEYTNLVTNPAYAADLDMMRSLLVKGWKAARPPVYKRYSFYRDADKDGYGTDTDSILAYFSPEGYAGSKGDCNDNNPGIHPSATEIICNGTDDNCNQKIDEPLPVITPLGSLDICLTGFVDLKANDGIGLSYQWWKDRKDIPGATLQTYRATSTGKYKVIISYSDSCSNTSKGVVVTRNSCSITANKQNAEDAAALSPGFLIYPNPSSGILHVNYNITNVGIIQFTVWDMAGRSLFTKTEQAIIGADVYELNLSNLKPGTYYLQVINNSISKRIKFMIER